LGIELGFLGSFLLLFSFSVQPFFASFVDQPRMVFEIDGKGAAACGFGAAILGSGKVEAASLIMDGQICFSFFLFISAHFFFFFLPCSSHRERHEQITGLGTAATARARAGLLNCSGVER
jgi:hypothetical protein